jgi:hypothetical protein
MNITAIAGTAGRITGTAARHLIWLNDQIDWSEVGAIVLHGLQVLIVLTLLAGRYTRRAWDALVPLSERMGKAYAAWLVGTPATPVVVTVTPRKPEGVCMVQLLAMDGMSQRQIAKTLGISRSTVQRKLATV